MVGDAEREDGICGEKIMSVPWEKFNDFVSD